MPPDAIRPAWRRIAILLVIASLTLVAFCAIGEGAARLAFRQSPTSTLPCLVTTDARTGVRGVPNSICTEKPFEGPPVDYRFNACGFRTPQPCGPAPTGTYRIVMIGSSLAFGMNVPQAETFAARLGPMLGERMGRPVDLFNQAMQWGMPAGMAQHADTLFAQRPDMLLWTLTPFDINNVRLILPYISPEQPGALSPIATSRPQPTAAAPRPLSPPARAWRRIVATLSDTRMVFAIRHYLYGSPSQYLSHTLGEGGAIDYLRPPPSPQLRDNLAVFAQLFARIAARARAAHVPLVVTMLPSRAQAIMLSNGSWETGYDPHQLDRLLRPIVEAQGGRYVDMMPGLERMPDAGRPFYPVDEHPKAAGHRMMAELLRDALLHSGALPAGAGVRR